MSLKHLERMFQHPRLGFRQLSSLPNGRKSGFRTGKAAAFNLSQMFESTVTARKESRVKHKFAQDGFGNAVASNSLVGKIKLDGQEQPVAIPFCGTGNARRHPRLKLAIAVSIHSRTCVVGCRDWFYWYGEFQFGA